jgi:glycosyltransferase involved in cell wall biosynthesis
VDLQQFLPGAELPGVPVIVLPARLLWDKGVGEFIDAARQLKKQGVTARFVLAGLPDPANPSAVTYEQIAAWVTEGVVEHLGWVKDMPKLLAASHIVCLPSYREGMPKSLIEAAAAGKPIVTTDSPGCREIVRAEENGILVPPRDSVSLAKALARLIHDPALRQRMGACGRSRAENEFSLELIVSQTLALYAEASD